MAEREIRRLKETLARHSIPISDAIPAVRTICLPTAEELSGTSPRSTLFRSQGKKVIGLQRLGASPESVSALVRTYYRRLFRDALHAEPSMEL